jgi:iron(III) transport system ATP-binding protein
MSMIFQSYALWPHMTVAENVAYGLKIRKLDKATIDARLKAILSTTRLESLADRYPGELSGGQQQRASLARALVVEPDTLLLDEPLSSLDANLREEMRFEVRRLHDAYRITSIYVTHDQGEAMTTADLIAVMNAGRIEQLGTPEEVYDRPRSEFVARFLGGSNILRGKALDSTHVSFAGTPIECRGASLAAGAEVAVCIRQHDIAMSNHATRPAAANAVQCTVVRNVFLGNARDYLVEASDGTQLRITAAPDDRFTPGASVWLTLPPERCRALVS